MWVNAGPARVINTPVERLTWEGMEQLPASVAPHDHVDAYFDWERLDYYLGKDRRVRVRVGLGNRKVITKYYSDGGLLRAVWRGVYYLRHRKIRIQF